MFFCCCPVLCFCFSGGTSILSKRYVSHVCFLWYYCCYHAIILLCELIHSSKLKNGNQKNMNHQWILSMLGYSFQSVVYGMLVGFGYQVLVHYKILQDNHNQSLFGHPFSWIFCLLGLVGIAVSLILFILIAYCTIIGFSFSKHFC